MSADKAKSKTKTEVIASIATSTGLTRAQVSDFFDVLQTFVMVELKSNGQVTVPGLVRVKATQKPATAERKAISPLTKQEVIYKAKPARLHIKASPVKGLKDSLAPSA